MWIAAACASAFFAGITAILAKCGVRKTDSDIATAIRTVVVLLFAWLIVFATGAKQRIGDLSPRPILFLVLSGLATCGSWLCYFKALSVGDVNKVVPVDKSGIVLAVLAGIIFFRETASLPLKLLCVALIAAGTFLMIERASPAESPNRSNNTPKNGYAWLPYAFLSAALAAATSVLAKVGLDGIDANLGTAVRTVIILAAAWGIVVTKRKLPLVKRIPRHEAGFLILSGLSTGISWICYFYAIQTGPISAVVPIDRLSILVTVLFARVVFREELSTRAMFGLACIVAGTVGLTAAG
ncbi:MAG: EamA family transporter [Thermoguttaceae bacterium]|nr:EamA family transporter [Thermoguttaceae bacterium]